MGKQINLQLHGDMTGMEFMYAVAIVPLHIETGDKGACANSTRLSYHSTGIDRNILFAIEILSPDK